jgi:hypothetical protein
MFFMASWPGTYIPSENVDPVKEITLSDGRKVLVNIHLDNDSIPTFYSSQIHTAVCESGECKPVEIIIKWDLLGNYLGYKMPRGKLLLKDQHIEFSPKEYQKFHHILSDKYSMLEDFDPSELSGKVESAKVKDVDAVTGATPKAIKAAIIPGALFTCYTIWNLVNGELSEEIKKLTYKNITNSLLKTMLFSGDVDQVLWSLENIKELPEDQFWIETLTDSNTLSDGFLRQRILMSLTEEWKENPQVLNSFWGEFRSAKYNFQSELLNQYKHIQLPCWAMNHTLIDPSRVNIKMADTLIDLINQSKCANRQKVFLYKYWFGNIDPEIDNLIAAYIEIDEIMDFEFKGRIQTLKNNHH